MEVTGTPVGALSPSCGCRRRGPLVQHREGSRVEQEVLCARGIRGQVVVSCALF